MLYLITSGNYMKIGYSQDLDSLCKRMKLYLCHAPDFYLVGVCNGDVDKEAEYQNLYRQKQSNEYTLFDDCIVKLFIKEESFCTNLSEYARKNNIKWKYIYDSVYQSMMANYLASRGYAPITDNETSVRYAAEIASELALKYYR